MEARMISRRQLLASPLGLAVMTAVERASAKVKGRVIVDSQVHLWKAETDDWKYVPRDQATDARTLHYREARALDG
jgi:hypothetical protein